MEGPCDETLIDYPIAARHRRLTSSSSALLGECGDLVCCSGEKGNSSGLLHATEPSVDSRRDAGLVSTVP